jgi:hypothetical protein
MPRFSGRVLGRGIYGVGIGTPRSPQTPVEKHGHQIHVSANAHPRPE